MSFANALNILRPTLPYYVTLTKYGLLRISKDCFDFDPNPAAPPIALEMARAVFTMGASSYTESFVMSRTLAEGLRRPDLRGAGELRPQRVHHHRRPLAAVSMSGDRTSALPLTQ
jgi:hypothetical protein